MTQPSGSDPQSAGTISLAQNSLTAGVRRVAFLRVFSSPSHTECLGVPSSFSSWSEERNTSLSPVSLKERPLYDFLPSESSFSVPAARSYITTELLERESDFSLPVTTASLSPDLEISKEAMFLRVSMLPEAVLRTSRDFVSFLSLTVWLTKTYGAPSKPRRAADASGIRVSSNVLRLMQATVSFGISSFFFLSIFAWRVTAKGALILQTPKSAASLMLKSEARSMVSSCPVSRLRRVRYPSPSCGETCHTSIRPSLESLRADTLCHES